MNPVPVRVASPAGVANPSLSLRLRQATRAAHQRAESHPWMARLMAGELDPQGHASGLAALQPVYDALEAGLAQQAAHPALAAIDRTGLARSAALRADLRHWQAVSGHGATAVPAARALATRIATCAHQAPERLLAHAYVRYLGDLHGGQLLARVVGAAAARWPLPAGRSEREQGVAAAAADDAPLGAADGVAFYRFDPAVPVAQRIRDLRAALDAAPLDAAAADAVVDEALDAFERHAQIFDALLLARRPGARAAARRALPQPGAARLAAGGAA